MKKCILGLYRSAVNASQEWGSGLGEIRTPGVVFWGRRDPFAELRFGERVARDTGAQFAPMHSGHWYQVERTAEVARELTEFWSGLD